MRSDPRSSESEPRLVEALREEILAAPGRRITFARFMERALTEPGLGYYATSVERPTRAGDFLSAPELHPMFGHCLARFLETSWRRLGEPGVFVVREWGAGRGTLERDVRAGLRADGSRLLERLAWQPVDVPGRHPVPPAAPFEGVVLANEFVDALPVHRLGVRAGRLQELYVTWRDGWFAEAAGRPSTSALEAHLEAEGVGLRDGQRTEVCLALGPWLAQAVADLARGWLVVIDYGHRAAQLHGPRRMAGTLMTYRAHRVGDDPFVAVGRQDITCHVDITALQRAAEGLGLRPDGESDLAAFLIHLGLGGLLSDLGRRAGTDEATYLAARAAVARLLDPRHLGAFRVLRWSRGVPLSALLGATDGASESRGPAPLPA